MLPTRELYWHISNHWLIYPMMVVALAAFFYGFYRKYARWKLGQPAALSRLNCTGIKTILSYGFGHKRLLNEKYPGMMHLAIFAGFIILLFGTMVVAAHDHLNGDIFYGHFYLGLSLLLDLFGLVAIIGILLALYRRYVIRPDRLDNRPDDLISLLLILAILVTGFLLEGLRIYGTGDPWAAWSPVGKLFSLLFGRLSFQEVIELYPYVWWGHLVFSFVFIAYIPYSKVAHMFISPLSLYFRRFEPKGMLPFIDFEDENRETFGAEKIRDLTWVQLMQTDACTLCGRCQDHCPGYLTKKPLSPKKVIQLMRQQLKEETPQFLPRTSGEKAATEAAAANHITNGAVSLLDNRYTKDMLWSCTTCGACEEHCPVLIEHIDRTVEIRRHLVLMEGDIPPELTAVYRNLENNGNPWGTGWQERTDWAKDLDLKTVQQYEECQYIYWVGCAGAFDPRNRKVAVAVTGLLQLAGIQFAILGTEEKCCGDSARRTGNEFLFQTLAQENITVLNQYKDAKIITSCPHCYNALKNEYPQLGGNFEVIHHTEILSQLLKEGVLDIGSLDSKDTYITYHDSCYLGRYNDIYHQPRAILEAIPGVKLIEMKRNKDRSFCCGAGGGRMWLEEKIGTKINEERTTELLQTETTIAATACPFCLTMLDDGVKAKEISRMQILDISEILVKALDEKHSKGRQGKE